jgi:hypothetical protein
MMKRIIIKGGGHITPLLCILIFFINLNLFSEESFYRGALNHFDTLPNTSFTLSEEGNITIGGVFDECIGIIRVDPRGILMVGNEIDFPYTRHIKWYRIEQDSFIKSDILLPDYYLHPVYWTPTPFRLIAGHYPIRVWQLDPVSLDAWLISEYLDPDAVGSDVAYVSDLNLLFLNSRTNYDLRRVNYNDITGQVTGPTTMIPISNRGNYGMTQTSDGRLLFVCGSGIGVSIFHVEDDGSLTTIRDGGFFGMANISKFFVGPQDKFIFFISVDGNKVNSFEILPSGDISPISQLTGFPLAQAGALTPDGKYFVVSHSYYYYPGIPAIMSVFEVGEDGSLTHIPEKDTNLPATVYEVVFFPSPQWPTSAQPVWEMYE